MFCTNEHSWNSRNFCFSTINIQSEFGIFIKNLMKFRGKKMMKNQSLDFLYVKIIFLWSRNFLFAEFSEISINFQLEMLHYDNCTPLKFNCSYSQRIFTSRKAIATLVQLKIVFPFSSCWSIFFPDAVKSSRSPVESLGMIFRFSFFLLSRDTNHC